MSSIKTAQQLFLIVSIFFSLIGFTQEVVTITLDQSLSPPLMGYNSDMSNTPTWSNPEFSKALNDLHTNTLRYPGGSNSLYWDWQTGWTISYQQLIPFLYKYNIKHNGRFIQDPQELKAIAKENRTKNSFWRQIYRYNAKPPKYNTIKEFAQGIKATQSTAVFTLNITTSHLEKELSMLKAAKREGIKIEYIELGNEIYAKNLLTSAVYPSVDNYIDTCLLWSEAIWKEFPNAKIGVVGGDRNKRTQHWNEQLSKALIRTISKTNHSQIYFILHYYSYFKEPKYDFSIEREFKQLMAYPKMDLQRVLKNTRWEKTSYFSTWVTEYNIIENKPYSINNSWAHGLLVASQINQLLQQTESDLFHFHSIGAQTFPVFAALHLMNKDDTYLTPTTSGIVTAAWNKLCDNASQFYSTTNDHYNWLITYPKRSATAPNSPRNEKKINFNPLHAYVSYDKDNKVKLLIVNLSSDSLDVKVDSIIDKGHITHHFGLPTEYSYKTKTLPFKSTLEIPPYSLNLVEQ